MNLLTMAIPWYARWIALVALCAAFGGWCYVHGMEHTQAAWNAEKVTQQAEALKEEHANRAKEQSWAKQLEDAQNAATKRETAIRADADAARQSADSLRDQLAAAKRAMSTASADAVRIYANSLADVFSDCAEKYRGMAQEADGQSSDKQTLEQAWPK